MTLAQVSSLGPFLEAGVLNGADLAVAQTIARLGGETRTDVVLAAALCVRALRSGSVCLDLRADPRTWLPDDPEAQEGTEAQPVALPWPQPQAWAAAVAASPLVCLGAGAAPNRPLRLVGNLLYLQRYWADEQLIAAAVGGVATPRRGTEVEDQLAAALDAVFGSGSTDSDSQRRAAAAVALGGLTIVAGGPGTGKTTTVARMIAVSRLLDPTTRVLLAAPTGKAAARLSEAVALASQELPAEIRAVVPSIPATTIHRMLGWRPDSRTRFRHNVSNLLPADLVIIDESSMVSLPLMARVMEAVEPTATLVLVGDADQLASVEAGAVLADLVSDTSGVGRHVVELDRTFRFGGAIAELASSIRRGDADTVMDILGRGSGEVCLHAPTSTVPDPAELLRIARDSGMVTDVVAAHQAVVAAAATGDAEGALRALDSHRVLCAHREGRFGADVWGDMAATWTAAAAPGRARVSSGAGRVDATGQWHVGQPLLVTANDYATDLFNGDTAVIVATEAGLRAAFGRGAGILLVPPSRLDSVVTMRAMTIHKAQGSQFGAVSIVLPPPESRILTRELLYTAVTRARSRVRIIGTEAAVRAAVGRRVARASGLRGSPTRGPVDGQQQADSDPAGEH